MVLILYFFSHKNVLHTLYDTLAIFRALLVIASEDFRLAIQVFSNLPGVLRIVFSDFCLHYMLEVSRKSKKRQFNKTLILRSNIVRMINFHNMSF